jgi:hypothetical protein
LLNSNLSAEARYATLVHELAHLYCGHLGTLNDKWWPDRRGLPHAAREFEAKPAICVEELHPASWHFLVAFHPIAPPPRPYSAAEQRDELASS